MHYIFCSSLSYTTGLFRPVNQLSTISLLVEVVDSSDTSGDVLLYFLVRFNGRHILNCTRTKKQFLFNSKYPKKYELHIPSSETVCHGVKRNYILTILKH